MGEVETVPSSTRDHRFSHVIKHKHHKAEILLQWLERPRMALLRDTFSAAKA